jgi:hypothetical protein
VGVGRKVREGNGDKWDEVEDAGSNKEWRKASERGRLVEKVKYGSINIDSTAIVS